MTQTKTKSSPQLDKTAEVIEFAPWKKGYACRFSWDDFLVRLVKKLPSGERKWIAEGKYWYLAPGSACFVAMVARRCGYRVTGIEDGTSE